MTKIHTPTPYVIREQKGEIQIWEDRMDGRVRHESCVAVMNGNPTDEAHADAEFIVRACNSHDQLVAALVGLMGHFDKASFDGAFKNARAALAAAGAA